MSQGELERFWVRRAARLARRCNTAWWLERFNLLALVGLLVFAAALLLARTWRAEWLFPPAVVAALFGLLALFALAARFLGRPRFVDAGAGLARLDDRLGLHGRLVSAGAGVGPWPPLPPPELPVRAAFFRWNLPRACGPGFAAAAVVAGAWWMPLPEESPVAPAVAPGAWEQMDQWLETLAEESVVEEDAVEEFASRVEELRDRPEEEWFGHSSLEATDTLQQALGQEIRDLAADMNDLERNLAALQAFSSRMGEEARERLARDFGEALDALGAGALPLEGGLREQLDGIDPSKLGREGLAALAPEQLEALREQLRNGAQALGSLEGLPGADPASTLSGLGEGMGFGDEGGGMPGRGGLNRGRGDAPLTFGEEVEGLGSSRLEGVANEDFSRATVGEVLGLGETERELDKTATGPVGGGAVSSLGRGGEAVSRESLLPDEQAVLKRYFK